MIIWFEKTHQGQFIYVRVYIYIYMYLYIYDINGSYYSIFWRILKIGWWLLCKFCRTLVQPRFNLQKSQLFPAEYGRFVLETYPHACFCKPRLVALFFSRCSSFPIYNSEPHFPLALTKLVPTSITSHQFFTKLNQWVPQVWSDLVGRIETIEGSTRGVTLGRPGFRGLWATKLEPDLLVRLVSNQLNLVQTGSPTNLLALLFKNNILYASHIFPIYSHIRLELASTCLGGLGHYKPLFPT